MCQNPINHNGKIMACRRCWQCHENKINDWVGRAIAESKNNKYTYVITLTYGRDEDGQEYHPRSQMLHVSDVQKLLKTLRREYAPRYIYVGEYGGKKRRAHWHMILFTQKQIEAPLNKFVAWSKWTHGNVMIEKPRGGNIPSAMKYVLKYLSKDMDTTDFKMGMSKKPPIGAMYFEQLAQKQVSAGIPASAYYHFDEKKYKMSSATLRDYMRKYNQIMIGQNRVIQSKEMDEYLDRVFDGFTPQRRLYEKILQKYAHDAFQERKAGIPPYEIETYAGWIKITDNTGVTTWLRKKEAIAEKIEETFIQYDKYVQNLEHYAGLRGKHK